MGLPSTYFTDPNERLLADVVWEIAGKPSNDPAWKKHPITYGYLALPQTTRRVVLARDWITASREMMDYETGKDDGGVRFINDFFEERYKRRPGFTATQIANVEHFFVSALYSDITGPAVLVPVGLTAVWEFAVGPVRIVAQEAARGVKGEGFRGKVILKNLRDNANQFLGPDMAGFNFGISSGAKSALTRDVDQIVTKELDAKVGEPLATSPMSVSATYKRKVCKGDTLSLLAKEIYKDPMKWPLIWMRNRGKALSTNYNVLPEGSWIEVPLPASVTQADLAESRRIAANWRPGLSWR